MTPFLGQLNFAASIVVLLGSLLALYRLTGRFAQKGRFIVHGYFCWTIAWSCWVVLWYLLAFTNPNRLPTLLLSDLNSIFFLLFYVGLTRGDDLPGSKYFILALIFGTICATADITLLHFPGDGIGTRLHDRWSMALSMISPVLIGLALQLRFSTYRASVVAVIYALAQPAAYEALGGRMPEVDAAIVFALLAVLKIVFGYLVLDAVRRLPGDYGTLVRTPAPPSQEETDRWWPALPLLVLMVGLISVLILARVRNPEVYSSTGISFSGVVAAIAAVLEILNYFGLRFVGDKK
jgi:hypothetical protein